MSVALINIKGIREYGREGIFIDDDLKILKEFVEVLRGNVTISELNKRKDKLSIVKLYAKRDGDNYLLKATLSLPLNVYITIKIKIGPEITEDIRFHDSLTLIRVLFSDIVLEKLKESFADVLDSYEGNNKEEFINDLILTVLFYFSIVLAIMFYVSNLSSYAEEKLKKMMNTRDVSELLSLKDSLISNLYKAMSLAMNISPNIIATDFIVVSGVAISIGRYVRDMLRLLSYDKELSRELKKYGYDTNFIDKLEGLPVLISSYISAISSTFEARYSIISDLIYNEEKRIKEEINESAPLLILSALSALILAYDGISQLYHSSLLVMAFKYIGYVLIGSRLVYFISTIIYAPHIRIIIKKFEGRDRQRPLEGNRSKPLVTVIDYNVSNMEKPNTMNIYKKENKKIKDLDKLAGIVRISAMIGIILAYAYGLPILYAFIFPIAAYSIIATSMYIRRRKQGTASRAHKEALKHALIITSGLLIPLVYLASYILVRIYSSGLMTYLILKAFIYRDIEISYQAMTVKLEWQ